MFLGREREKRVIRDLVAGVSQRGGALVVIGDPGIGKSTLAGLARQFASRQGLTVLATTGVPAESRLPYAGLHQLLRPLRDGIDDLPRPQRDALLSAFGQGTDRVPDRFLVALAVPALVNRFAGSVGRAGLDLADRARLALLQENIRIDRTESAERIRYLVELARKIRADRQADLAMDLLMSAARRCWQGTPDLRTRLLISETALELTADPLHPVLLSVLAYATPDIHGSLVRSRLARLAGETSLDPGQLIYRHLRAARDILEVRFPARWWAAWATSTTTARS